MKGVRLMAAAALALASGGGCLYDSEQSLPANIKRIAVPAMKNETSIFQLDTDLTEATRAKFLIDGRLQVVDPDQMPQAELSCGVVQYAKEPAAFDQQTNRVQHWRLRLQVKMLCTDLSTKAVIWREPADVQPVPFETTTEYYEPGNAQGMVAGTEEASRKTLVDEMARRIVRRTIDGW